MRNNLRHFLTLSLLCFGFLSTAVHAETFAIINGVVHTQAEAGVIKEGTVLIRDGRIAAVGSDVVIPEDATVIDAAGKVVTPGLMDPSTNLGLVEVGAVDDTVDYVYSGDRFNAAHYVADAINPRSTLIPVQRIEGVTRTASVPGTSWSGGKLIHGQSAVISLGSVDDFILVDRAAMHAAFGETGSGYGGESRGGAMLALREALQDAKDFGNNRRAFEAADRYDYALSRLDLEAMQPVLRGEMPFVVTVHRASDIEAVLRLAEDFDLDLVINGGAEAWMVADQLAAAEVPVIIDALQNLPSSFEMIGSTLQNAAALNAAGVKVAFTAGSHNARNITQYAGNAVANGLPWTAALEAMTVNPAAIYGVENFGRIAPGYDADVVVWDGDPLEVTTFADHVFIRGEKVEMTSRQIKLRERYRDDEERPQAYDTP
ncbi:MAG: amidohydrolase family protein [Gammaproteobacteria bacterium]|nr:amidohydrolase family protein [Gammaproteobacteria bacterium]